MTKAKSFGHSAFKTMSFSVTIIGSSGALPAYGRFPSCQLVEIQNRYFLIDCGEGAQIQLTKYQTNFHRVSHIFISHLHGDHYLGLMGLLFTMHLLRRTNELHIYSHPGLDEIITTQFKHSRSVPSFPIHFHVLQKDTSQIIFEDNQVMVETLPLRHRLPCSGFLFREKPKPRRVNKEVLPPGLLIQQIANLKRGHDVTDENGNVLYKNEQLTLDPRRSRSYAYCSDTAYNERLIEKLRDVNLLFHEATFTKDEQSKANETLHSTAEQAGMMAKRANAERLVIGHFSARYKDLTPVLDEAKAIFPNTYLANEGEIFSIAE